MADIVADDLFALPSAPLLAALKGVHALLRVSGFRVHAPRTSDATIRAYTGRKNRPLVNPRFYERVRIGRRAWSGSCLILHVLDEDQALIADAHFESNTDCFFHSLESERPGEYAFVIPVQVSERGEFAPELTTKVVSSLKRAYGYIAPRGAL